MDHRSFARGQASRSSCSFASPYLEALSPGKAGPRTPPPRLQREAPTASLPGGEEVSPSAELSASILEVMCILRRRGSPKKHTQMSTSAPLNNSESQKETLLLDNEVCLPVTQASCSLVVCFLGLLLLSDVSLIL